MEFNREETLSKLKVFFTAKKLMILFLVVLLIINLFSYGLGLLISLLISVLTASILDLIIIYIKDKKFLIPESAIITGLFISVVLDTSVAPYILVIASSVAILSKYLIRIKGRQIFNPAVLGLVLVGLIFKANYGWLLYNPSILVIILGLLLMYYMKNYYLIGMYFASYIILASIYLFFTKNLDITILLGMNFFFMFFILTEPKTSPYSKLSKIIYGSLAGILSFVLAFFMPSFIEADLFSLLLVNISSYFLNEKF